MRYHFRLAGRVMAWGAGNALQRNPRALATAKKMVAVNCKKEYFRNYGFEGLQETARFR